MVENLNLQSQLENSKPQTTKFGQRVKFLLIIVLGFFFISLINLGILLIKSDRSKNNQSEEANQAKNFETTSPLSQLLKQPTVSPFPTPSPTQSPILPAAKTLIGGSHIFQTFNNCGPASLSMTLSYYDVVQSQQTLGQALRPYQIPNGNNDDKSVTLRELAAKASEFGFLVYHRPAGSIDLLEKFIANDFPVITRTLLNPSEDIGHYRVIKGYNQLTQELVQDDSLQGKNLTYKYEAFDQLWAPFNYEFLVLVPAEKNHLAEEVLGKLITENYAWQKALELANHQLIAEPNNVYAQLNKSVALYYLGDYPNSVKAYEQAAVRLPFRTLWYQLEPILAYYQLQQYDQVIKLTDKILANQNQAYAELHYLKGKIYQDQNQPELAAMAFAKATKYNQASYWLANLNLR